ncbi:MAG: NfeD family protein [Anaerolineales bacterium]|jgi:membrane-bound serine protease (ClpP class)
MDFLLNPNVAYLLLVFGTITLMMALLTPGTFLLEGAALLLLAGAGYALYHLGFNLWALIVLVVSLAPFVYALRTPKWRIFLAVSLLCFIIGSVYLFPSTSLIPAVNPIVAVVVSILAVGFVWFVTGKVLLAQQARPLQDLRTLIGRTGQAKTQIQQEGAVQVAGELWSARSEKPITAGSRVRVVSREGFTLVVERDDQSKK